MSKKRKELEEGWKARTQDLMSKEKRSVPPHAPACFRHTCIYAPPASFISFVEKLSVARRAIV